MIIVMDEGVEEAAVEAVISRLVGAGCDVHRSSGAARTILGIVGEITEDERAAVAEFPGVSQVVAVTEPYRRVSRRFRGRPTVVEGDWGRIGGGRPWVAVEPVGLPTPSDDDGGRPPSLPYAIASGRPFDAAISRSKEPPDHVGALACLALHPRARTTRWPVTFVRRDPVWSPDEWLVAAEREIDIESSGIVLLEAGGRHVVGPRTFDVAALCRTRRATHLPIVVDVPAIASRSVDTEAIASAAVAAGADGVILRATLDAPGPGSVTAACLRWDEAVDLANRLRSIGEALSR